jgi:hypothetical protein
VVALVVGENPYRIHTQPLIHAITPWSQDKVPRQHQTLQESVLMFYMQARYIPDIIEPTSHRPELRSPRRGTLTIK